MQLCASPQPTLQQAIDTLIDCFGRHDTQGYFDCFHPEARFVFYTVPGEVLSKTAYRQRWHQWEQEAGFRVLGCESIEPELSEHGDCAILSHSVITSYSIHYTKLYEMLNYRQLYYFWQVARLGGITRAAEQLHLTPQTLSGQIAELERTLGTPLFNRQGRRLELSAAGELALPHAEQIFLLGNELEALLHQPARQGELTLKVGLTDAVPKSVAYRLMAPALGLAQPVRLVCHEEKPEKLSYNFV